MSEIHETKGIYLYGNVALIRAECPICGSMGILTNNRTQCCGVFVDGEAELVQRMTEPANRRNRPSPKQQKKILTEQHYRCVYCSQMFGTMHNRNGKPVHLGIHYDHRVPFAYSQDNRNTNFVAACQVCNGIKSDHIFETLLEAIDYIEKRRKEKGYDF